MHTYELIEINCGVTKVLYTATSRQDLYRAYRSACQRGALVRMRIDGKIMPIYQADAHVPAETRGGRKCPN
jgi:hypothetical protein